MQRRIRISYFLTESEAAEVRRRAEAAGTNPSDFSRSMVLGHTPKQVPQINVQAYRELARSASNLNQIARNLNKLWQSGGLPGLADIEDIRAELLDFRVKLLGMKNSSGINSENES